MSSMMRPLAFAVALTATLDMAGNVSADSIVVFNAIGMLEDRSTISGTLTIDTTIGSITAADIIISGTTNSTLTEVHTQNANFPSAGLYNVILVDPADLSSLQLELSTSNGTLVNYAGGPIESGVYLPIGGDPLPLNSFTLTPAAVPEPGSCVLLVTGGVCAIGLARARLKRQVS